MPLLIVLLFLASLFQIQTLHYLAVIQHLPAFSLHLQIQYQLVFLHLQVLFLHPQFLLFHHQSYFVHLEAHLLLFAFVILLSYIPSVKIPSFFKTSPDNGVKNWFAPPSMSPIGTAFPLQERNDSPPFGREPSLFLILNR